MLAVWYMDDGSKCRARDVYLNSQQFSIEDQHTCLALLTRHGIDGAFNKDKNYYRIRVKTSAVQKLFNFISPYIIPSMAYKIEL